MKKIFTVICILVTVQASAVTVSDVAGVFKGTLNVGGTEYSDQEVYVLPGTASNSVTLVMPSVAFSSKCADLMLVNMGLSSSGSLSAGSAAAYVKSISASSLSASSLSFTLSLVTPAQTTAATVTFSGSKVTNRNYAITNGGFEGNWSGNEPAGWHSFASADGSFASFVTSNTGQFTQQTDVRPGSTGSHSARLQSKTTFGVKANGNCTNGRINAGSMTADDASGNYSFSDPSNSGYNTPFVGCPDSLVFWAKYVPGGGTYETESNKASAHAILTTNARYQDPETDDYSTVKIAEATSHYSAIDGYGWQRLSVPFVYTSVDPSQMAYMLLTFSTNKTPGGGNSTKKNPDNVYLDDAEMIYNHSLTSFTLDGTVVSFSNGQATSSKVFSDQDYTFAATSNGKAAKTFVGFDATNNRVQVYVVADNYSQAQAYSVYTLQMTEPVKDTEYAYMASTCQNEPYSDNLFHNLTEAGEYHTTIPNTQGGDSLITLTLSILPTYSTPATATIDMDKSYTWRGHTYENLVPGVYNYTDELKTKAGCDSLFTLTLTVKAIPYAFNETMTACQNEATTWHGKTLPTDQTGTFTVKDELKSIYNTDSVYTLTLTVLSTYRFKETKYVNEADLVWHGKTIQGLPQRTEPYLIYDSLLTTKGCDSVYVLELHVSEIPITYGVYEAATCEGDYITFNGVKYRNAFEGDILVSAKNIYGGDSIVHLVVTMLPTYEIEEDLYITEGDDAEWEYYDLSSFSAGEYTLDATYYSEADCDSTMVLNLYVRPVSATTGLNDTTPTKRVARKVFYNGQLYIIREDESIYDLLGNKIK